MCWCLLREHWHSWYRWLEPERYLPVLACCCWPKLKVMLLRFGQSSWWKLVMTRWKWLKRGLLRLTLIDQQQKCPRRRPIRKPGCWCRNQKSC